MSSGDVSLTSRRAAPAGASGDDIILPFQVGDTAVRGRVVRLGPAIDQILSAHGFYDPLSELVAEAATLVSAMGAALKFDGKLILQLQGDGPVPLVVADYTAGGGLRAMASSSDGSLGSGDSGDARDSAAKPDLKDLVGAKSHMMLTVDQGPDMDRYQGVTPLDGARLEEAAVAYFDQSEQIPSAVRLAVGRLSRPGQPPQWRAGGVLAQFVPAEGGERERGEAILQSEGDRETWARAEAFLSTIQADELLDPDLSPESLLYRLFHEDGVRVFDASPVRAHCTCNPDKIRAVLSRYTAEDLADMVEDGAIRVTCEFCRKTFAFDKDTLELQNAESE
ncbi:MAG: Hsp33 family molecular chaperone [Pseudomonadota bacterium]